QREAHSTTHEQRPRSVDAGGDIDQETAAEYRRELGELCPGLTDDQRLASLGQRHLVALVPRGRPVAGSTAVESPLAIGAGYRWAGQRSGRALTHRPAGRSRRRPILTSSGATPG